MSSGAVTCGVYPTSASDQVAYVVGHSESKVLFIENEEQVDKVLQILPDLEKVKQIIIWDPKGLWGFTQ
jgi:long-chain acyl-CoA synthetase